jgi:hypothetical protein
MTDTVTVGQPAPDAPAAPAPSAPPAVTTPTPSPALDADNRVRPPVLNQTPDGAETLRGAAQRLANRRRELREQAAAAAAQAPAAAPPVPQSPPQEGDAAQPQASPGDPPAVDPVAAEPPSIDLPRGWKKEYAAAFQALPHEIQQQVQESERAREAEFHQRQREVAERQRSFDQELQQLQTVRQQYQQGLEQTLQMTMASNEFADIQTMEDVERLANTDWPRWVKYQTHQQKVGMMQQQLQEVQHQNHNERLTRWNQFAQEQDTLFSEKVPNAKELRDAAGPYLADAGFSPDEMAKYWNSAGWRDHRMQAIIADAIRYRQAKTKADQAMKAPAPPVVKPGVSAPKANPFHNEIAELSAKGSLTIREAARLNQLRRASATKK